MAAVLCALLPAGERHRPQVRAALVLIAGAIVDLRCAGALARGLMKEE